MDIVVSSVLSGVLASLITMWWNDKQSKKREKLEIFKTLMSNRYQIAELSNVETLNVIDVFFYKSKKVRQAWEYFLKKSNNPSSNEDDIKRAYNELLLSIAIEVGYRKITHHDIETSYYCSNEVMMQKNNKILKMTAENNQLVKELESSNQKK